MIPIYQAMIAGYDTGIYKISLVDDPAVQSDFLYFNNNHIAQKFAIENEEQKMITGVIMRADFPIYRVSQSLGEYYMKFSKETIKKMAEKMMQDHTFNNINLQHTDGTDVKGVRMVELFIKNSARGISPSGFDDIEEGSLFATYQVENDEIWQSIKNNTFKGFSLEGIFDLEIIKENTTHKNINKFNKKIMSLLNKILKQFVKLGSAQTDKGEVFWVGEADLQIGDELFYNTDTEEAVKVEDGEYKFTDGTVVVVKDGLVSEIKETDNKKESDNKKEASGTKKDKKEEMEDAADKNVSEDKKANDDKKEETGDAKIKELTEAVEDLRKKYEELKKAFDELASKPGSEPVVEEFRNKVKNDGFIPTFGSRSKLVRN